MNTVKRLIKSGKIGRALVIGAVYAAGAAVTKLSANYYSKALKGEPDKQLEGSEEDPE